MLGTFIALATGLAFIAALLWIVLQNDPEVNEPEPEWSWLKDKPIRRRPK